jgi:hypothetical protein
MLVLSHINAVLGARGDLAFFGHVFHLCHDSGLDLEGILSEMPEILNTLLKHPQHAHLKRKEEFALVGWSNRLDRPIGQSFVIKRSEPQPLAVGNIDFGFVSPPHWDLAHEPPPFESADDMVKMAREQAAYLQRRFPDGKQDGKFTSGGGRLIVARISREGMRIQTECDLGNLFCGSRKPTFQLQVAK